jgi:hypothetical protein
VIKRVRRKKAILIQDPTREGVGRILLGPKAENHPDHGVLIVDQDGWEMTIQLKVPVPTAENPLAITRLGLRVTQKAMGHPSTADCQGEAEGARPIQADDPKVYQVHRLELILSMIMFRQSVEAEAEEMSLRRGQAPTASTQNPLVVRNRITRPNTNQKNH